MPVDIADIRTIVDAQDQWRSRQTINLIASEMPEPAVRAIQNPILWPATLRGTPTGAMKSDAIIKVRAT